MENEIVINEESTIVVKDPTKMIEVAREVMPMAELLKTADMLSKSTIVPQAYQHRAENCFVAMDMASRMGVSVMMVMQNMHMIQGKPSWSGQAVCAMIRANPQFRNVTLNYVGTPNTDSWGAFVTAERISTGQILKGGTVTIATAKKEGWFQKAGSKWQTMPELMLAYRSYAWFGRVYCPEIMMGMQTMEETYDIVDTTDKVDTKNPYEGR